jgi:hypothetical protein
MRSQSALSPFKIKSSDVPQEPVLRASKANARGPSPVMADCHLTGAQFFGVEDALFEYPEGPSLTLEDLNDDFNYQFLVDNHAQASLDWGNLQGNPTGLVNDFDFSPIGSHVEPVTDFDFDHALGDLDGYMPVDFDDVLSSLQQESQHFGEDPQEYSHVSSLPRGVAIVIQC